MGKISVRHFLNTNLKPYIINGDRYFSIYALITAIRQNTKVKSKAFSEYYTENDFAEIVNPENKEDSEILKNEEATIINIASLLIHEFDVFDTTLFAAVYNYYQEIYIFDLDIESTDLMVDGKQIGKGKVNLFRKDKNKMGLGIDKFFIEPYSLKENQSKGISVFSWFSPMTQENLRIFLENNNCQYNIHRSIEIINKLVFYSSFNKLNWIFRGSKKYGTLIEKYSTFFMNIDTKIRPYFAELSIKD